jgi:hypothetical protein
MKILNNITCKLNWNSIQFNLDSNEFELHWIKFKMNWKEMGCKLVQNVFKICLSL